MKTAGARTLEPPPPPPPLADGSARALPPPPPIPGDRDVVLHVRWCGGDEGGGSGDGAGAARRLISFYDRVLPALRPT